jgi:hypothetical protein
MSESTDVYALYEAGARELLDRIRPDHKCYPNALDYQQRLSANIEQSRKGGHTDKLKAQRCRILNELNKLAVAELEISFRELCEQTELAQQQAIEHPPCVKDPVSLLEMRSEGPVVRVLKNVEKARSYANWGEVLHLCESVIRCKSNYRDQAGRATAQLHMADALARQGRIRESIDLTRRARRNFRIQRDYHNMILADLLLARLQLKFRQDLYDAHQGYRATRDLCQKLECRAKECMHGDDAQFYGLTIEAIQQVLDHIEQALAEAVSQSCCLNTIPILQFSDGPDKVSDPPKTLNYMATGRFSLEGYTYLLRPLNEAGRDILELSADATHFALPVVEDGWPCPVSKKDKDLALVWAQATQEGPGVWWTGQEWRPGRFERDTNTGTLSFAWPKPRFVGEQVQEDEEKESFEIKREDPLDEYGCAIGVLKPEGSVESPLDF